MTNIINFVYSSKHAFEVIDRPMPASSFIPEWFKNLEQYSGGKLITKGTGTSATAKKCIPLLDGMTTGYTLTLWTDIHILKHNNGKTEINWRTSLPVFETHPGAENYVPPPPGYDPTVYKFLSHFRINTPRGYSILVVPPAGHNDLPFKALPAVIDTDGKLLDFSFPMWLRTDFEGVLERGIPMVTIIPFERKSWKAKYSYVSEEQNAIDMDNGINKTIQNHYRNSIWKKKDFK